MKKGGYEDDDILGLGQGLSDVDWGALVGANEGDKDDKDEEDEDEGVDDDDEMDIDEDMDDFDDDEDEEGEDEGDEDEEELEEEVNEQPKKKKVKFAETVQVAMLDTQSTNSYSVASSDLNEEAFSSEEGDGSDTEMHEAIFGEGDSEEEEENSDQNSEEEEVDSDQIEAENGMYDSEEENAVLARLMGEGGNVPEKVEKEDEQVDEPHEDTSSEEAPVNPAVVFKSEKEKIAALPKSELGEETGGKGAGKYVPPALRNKDNALERSVRGFLNRLSGANLYSIANEFVQLYRANSRRQISTFLVKSIFAQLLLPVKAPQLLQEDYTCLVIVLNRLVSEDVSFFIVEEIILKYFQLEAELKATYENEMPKTLQNLLALVCSLTRLKLLPSKLLYEVLDRLIERFDLSSVELIKSIFNGAAFALRKDDPGRLKTTIQRVHSQARTKQAELEEAGGARIKFMLEMLTAVKNNNVNELKKSPGFVDLERDEGCKKRIRGVTGAVQLEPIPAIGLSDILNVNERGRWWRVGAAVVVKRNDDKKDEEEKQVMQVSSVLQTKAKKMGMNTDNKVFYISDNI